MYWKGASSHYRVSRTSYSIAEQDWSVEVAETGNSGISRVIPEIYWALLGFGRSFKSGCHGVLQLARRPDAQRIIRSGAHAGL